MSGARTLRRLRRARHPPGAADPRHEAVWHPCGTALPRRGRFIPPQRV